MYLSEAIRTKYVWCKNIGECRVLGSVMGSDYYLVWRMPPRNMMVPFFASYSPVCAVCRLPLEKVTSSSYLLPPTRYDVLRRVGVGTAVVWCVCVYTVVGGVDHSIYRGQFNGTWVNTSFYSQKLRICSDMNCLIFLGFFPETFHREHDFRVFFLVFRCCRRAWFGFCF